MIPKASQRGGGQDLATHLLNAFDNEHVEVAEVRGAVASDLHGAFAEWEAIGAALTKCSNYLYSLSVNPDWRQGDLTRDQYNDYANRVERLLGLTGQPRTMVFHIKQGREHCHIVWSRIDAREGKAIHMAFDHQKLMMVTREFAHDHGLMLPAGYEMNAEKARDPNRKDQISLYEKEQQRQSGLGKEEKMAQVTAAWQRSDTAKAFVRALEELGYVLAVGDKRPYVLVDLYGGMNALPKMIADRAVKTSDIRAFLEKDYPPESLPTIDEAKKLVAQHRQAREDFARSQRDGTQLERLKARQAVRRGTVLAEYTAQDVGRSAERAALDGEHIAERRALKRIYMTGTRRIKEARARAAPSGLAAFLGKVTGVSLLIHTIQQRRDLQRYDAYRTQHDALLVRQREATSKLDQRHRLQATDGERAVRALDQIDARERKSLETQQTRTERTRSRGDSAKMPALTLELKPRGRLAVPHKAMHRHRRRDLVERDGASKAPIAESETRDAAESLRHEFGRAVDGEAGEARSGRGSGSDGGLPPVQQGNRSRRRMEEELISVPEAADLSPDAPVPHWTEMPLANTFENAARDIGSENDDNAAGPGIRPSRSSRSSERGSEKGRASDDFERER